MDLAVGVIIGAAFQNIVTLADQRCPQPAAGHCLQHRLQQRGAAPAQQRRPAAPGAFISAVLNFVIMAFVLFCIVKAMNRLLALGRPKKEEAPAAPKGPTQEQLLADILTELRAQNDRETALTK